MEKEDLKKNYQDSIKMRKMKTDKWERALKGVAFKKNNESDKQIDYSIKQKK
ncbi:hypothetical protein [Enterococcus faecalis]|uniref:hypothetical protein n=1 Tax=Enterococcus faecalis TaxID=1351 RepID=UPI001F5A7690|nr:hypothetical protein [Enterococcus faecalis]